MPGSHSNWWHTIHSEYSLSLDDAAPHSPEEREALFEDHPSGEYFQHAIPTIDAFRTTEFPPLRRTSRSPPRRTPSPILPTPYSSAPASRSKPVDLRSLEYIEEFDHNLLCAICHSAFVVPVKLDCEHVFCQECINQALSHSENCPTCRKRITGRPMGVAVPKLIDRILDGLIVKCPLEGCADTVARGAIQAHVDQYCDYTEVKCPWDRCALKARRKDARKTWCTHTMLLCRDCREDIMERDLEDHREKSCKSRQAVCSHCNSEVLYQDLQTHISQCPDASLSCEAAPYGCDFKGKREILNEHLLTCPLNKLGPFLKDQKTRLEDHEVALKHLRQKNSIMEASLVTLTDVLSIDIVNTSTPSSSTAESGSAPFDSTADHLLSLHESLRAEVERVSSAITELDAKANMMVMNESLRNKEEMAHTNAALGNVRIQLHWLMNAKLQSQQRTSMVETQTSSRNAGPSMLGRGIGSPADMEGETLLAGRPIRKSSDSMRQETKL
ncbi:hypothetical protein MMC14_004538 [Varicellaria rhodocarpa]|nr:hypothetical protein [Varicellaria rhodocarpa]